MQKTHSFFLLLSIPVLLSLNGCSGNKSTLLDNAVASAARTEIQFDSDWLFFRGDTSGAEASDFSDSKWRSLDLPHDWSIENIPGKTTPFDSTAAGGLDAGYLVGGTGWYRKSFMVPDDLKGRHFILQFDGIYMNSDVWLNGNHLGQHPYGYTSFRYDITSLLKPGEDNTLAVRVKNEGHNSRWYSGSGIYRHVHISTFNPVHLDPWYLHITTPVIADMKALISVSAGIFNESGKPVNCKLITNVTDSTGKILAARESSFSTEDKQKAIVHELRLAEPELWSPEKPALYNVVNKLYAVSDNGKKVLLDSLSTKWGIRKVEISAEKGFVLNGVPLELKGGCMHHDNGPLGAAAFDRAEERRVELMKAAGFNAIRCSHNPPSPAFLDACDRLGMMVIDESFDMWSKPKNPDDYHLYFTEWWKSDVESMVRRDMNHPSIVMWSIGNEIPERNTPEGVDLAKQQYSFVKSIDSSRMITSAVNSLSPDKDPYFAVLDVAGYNYAENKYKSDHLRMPERIIISTESYALRAFDYWMGAVDNSWVIGDFVWTGFDYLGEAGIGWLGYPHDRSFYPWNHAYCGDIDICGFKRPQSYYRDILWNNGKQISLFVKPPVPSFPLPDHKEKWSIWEWQDVTDGWTWTGQDGKILEVEVYSSFPEVELLLNDKTLGRKKNDRSNEWLTKWNVPYSPGRLVARGVDKSGKIVESELKTAGETAVLKLTADRNNIKSGGQDLVYVTVELTDKEGIRNPLASDTINFEISGPGRIQATGSSDPMSIESFTAHSRKAYKGRCLIIIRSGKEQGDIILKASSQLGSSEIKISCN